MAFQVQYDGGKFSGFAYQEAEETIEKHLFDALIKLRLIESRQVRLIYILSINTQIMTDPLCRRHVIILVVDAQIKELVHMDKLSQLRLDQRYQRRFLLRSYLGILMIYRLPILLSKK